MVDGRGGLVLFSGDLGVKEWTLAMLFRFYREFDVNVLFVLTV